MVEGVNAKMIYLIYGKNFCKCYNAPTHSTTIKKREKIQMLEWKEHVEEWEFGILSQNYFKLRVIFFKEPSTKTALKKYIKNWLLA
jgi:hypothetical protein